MRSPNRKLRIAVVTTHPPSKGTLNEYGFHFVKALRQKPEVEELILLLEELPDEQTYTFDESGAPVSVRKCAHRKWAVQHLWAAIWHVGLLTG